MRPEGKRVFRLLRKSDDIFAVFRRLSVEFGFFGVVPRFAEQGEGRLFALFDARLVESVDVQHGARVGGLKLEQKEQLAEGEGVELGNPELEDDAVFYEYD